MGQWGPAAGALNLSEDEEAAPHPSQRSAARESTHSVGGTVGGVLVLCGLVPLVGRDPVVHEPETRSTGPENSVTDSQEARRPQP